MASFVNSQNLPPPQSPFVDKGTFNLSYDGYQFLLNLISNALSGELTSSVATGLVATGGNQATALLLTNDWNEISTSSVGSGVLLGSLQAGQSQVVFNASPNIIQIYPPPGAGINGGAANAPVTLGTNTRATYDFFSESQILT
jgi:hypothetical protein